MLMADAADDSCNGDPNSNDIMDLAGLLPGSGSGCGCLPLFLTPNPQCTAPTSRYLIGTAGGLNHACLQVDRSGLGLGPSSALH